MVTLRDPGDWFYSMFRYKDGLEAKAEVSGKKNWATFKEATGVSITTVDFGGYVEGSYYMWNTFARALAGDFGGQGINIVKVAMNKGRSDMLNELNDVKVNEVDTSDATINRSPILKAAVNRLKSFTFFAVKDRYKDSFDLFEFTFCTKSSRNSGFAHTKEQIVNFASGRTLANNQSRKKIFSEFQHVLDDKLRIDYLFYKIGLEIFDERVARMRDLQSRGISCSLYGSKCGVKCPY